MPRRIVVVTEQAAAALFSMGVAAQLSGLHPQTLRTYERHGLLSPQRTAGGTRLYSQADLEQAVRINELSALGMSRDGVAMVLALEAENRALAAEVQRLRRR